MIVELAANAATTTDSQYGPARCFLIERRRRGRR